MRLNDEVLREQLGVVSRAALLRWGNDDATIRREVARGGLARVRRGWFALPGADPRADTAARDYGSLSCASVLRLHGVWTLDHREHLRPGPRTSTQTRAGWTTCPRVGDDPAPRAAVDDLDTALRCAAHCLPDEELLMALDSVRNLGLRSLAELEVLLSDQPRRVQRVLARSDLAESGTETLVRNRLRARGVSVRSQVVIRGVGRVDLLVGRCLVIEVDSVQHHTSLQAYEADRERDRRLRALGYTPIRLTYRQVVQDWAAVEADILAMVARGLHRRRVVAAA